MRGRLSSVKNPKRQFSRRRRRHHRVADPDDIMLVSRPRGGFFAQYRRQLGTYAAAVALITMLFAKGSPAFAVAFCVLSLFIPLLWVVQYRRTKKRLELFASEADAKEVVQELS